MITQRLSLHKTTLIFILTTMIWITPVHAGNKYSLSVTPRFSSQEILSRLGPLAQFLGEKMHNPVEIVLAADFNSYEERLKAGEFDIAFSNPIHYSKASATNEVIAMEEKDTGAHIRGIIIARADSNIKTAKDLIGKSVSIVSWTSTAGFLSQKVFLEEQGINVKTQLKIQEAHDNKQENVVLSVYYGDVEAGFINEDALHIVDRYVPSNQIKIITETTWLPGWALSVKRALPEMVKARIREAVLGLSDDDAVLKAIKLQSFIAATDTDYDVVRKALEINVTQPVVAKIESTPVKCSPTPSTPIKTTAPAIANPTIIPIPVPISIPTKTEAQTTAAATTNAAGTKPSNTAKKPTEKKSNRKRKGKK